MRSEPHGHGRDSPIVSVVEAVASHDGVAVGELPPLPETINPDALNDLFTGTRDPQNAQTHVSLKYSGHTVRVYPDHTVIID